MAEGMAVPEPTNGKEALQGFITALEKAGATAEEAAKAFLGLGGQRCWDPHHKKVTWSRGVRVNWLVCPGCKYGSRVR